MGYYTTFTLNISNHNAMPQTCGHTLVDGALFCHMCGMKVAQTSFSIEEEVAEKSEEIIGFSLREMILDGENCKWYEWDEDMRKISALYPGWLFTLHGDGEESGDIWNAYFLGGKCQKEEARIAIDPFDESKLR